MRFTRLGAALERVPFSALTLILLGAFLVTRLPYFWFAPQVDLSLDSKGYLELVDSFRKGIWPQLLWRTPGYPLFLLLVTSIVHRWIAVVFVQNVLSFLSALCLVYSVYRLRRALALPAALALCGFLGSSQVLIYDISILSESVYTSTILFIVACIFLGFALDRAVFFALASALMGWAILDRPAAGYFVVICVFILLYLLWNRRRRAQILGLLLPLPALLLALCSYNYATAGGFVLTGFAEANLAGATMLFWEPDPRLPPQVNQALETLPQTYAKIGLTAKELALERTSWDTTALFELYAKAYNRLVWSSGFGTGWRFTGSDYIHNRALVRDTSMIAIRRHPDLYAKFVWVNLVEFFTDIGYKYDFDASREYRASGPNPNDIRASDLAPEGVPPVTRTTPASPERGTGSPANQSGPERTLLGLRHAWQTFHGILFQNVIWTWGFLLVSVLGLGQLVRHRGRHLGAFLLVLLALIPIGASLVVCLSEVALDRYSYPTQFVYYLSVALCPLLGFAGDGLRRVTQGFERSVAVKPSPA